MKTKILAGAVVAAVALTGLTACSTGNSGSPAATSITMWHNSADSPALLDEYKAFTKATGIRVNLVPIPSDNFETTTQTKWATGNRPDILEYHGALAFLLPLNPKKNMQDLSDMAYVKKSGDTYKSSGAVDGKVYAAITGFPEVFGLYYNKAAFEKIGAQPPASFEDLASDCRAFKAAGITPIYESGGSLWPTQILPMLYVADQNKGYSYGNAIATNKAKLTNPEGPFMKALEAYQALRDAGCFNADASTGTFEKATAAVVSGSVAMTALHSDVYPQVVAAADGDAAKAATNVGFVGLSSTSSTGTAAVGPIGTYYAPKTGNSGREAAARKFIEYVTGPGYSEFLKKSNQFPVLTGYPDPAGLTPLQESFKKVNEGASNILLANLPGFGQFATEMGKFLNKQISAEQVASDMQSAVASASKAAGVAGW